MNQRYRWMLAAAALLGGSAPALAQLRCDCTQVVDSCTADVAVVGSSVQITSDHRQCSRVDYFIDGQPFVSVAIEGEARESRPASLDAPKVLVQSCQVCADRSIDPAVAAAQVSARDSAAETASRDDGPLEALIEVRPAYPPAALPLRLEGFVELEFTVNAEGHVQSASVTASDPATVFDAAAMTAIGRWRYPAEPGREPLKLAERFEFRPPEVLAPAPSNRRGAARPDDTRGAAGATRNECVREGPVFDYGDVVEVGLQNTCSEPVLVFSCALGTGRYQGRWRCTDSVEQHRVLVGPGDARLGGPLSVTTAQGVRPLTYADQFFVSRAPNSEYWWLACHIDDGDCRSRAGLWTRSLDRQAANVDPQGRSGLAVARSH
jgi:TonB family protein